MSAKNSDERSGSFGNRGSARVSPSMGDIRALNANTLYAKVSPELKLEIVRRATIRFYRSGDLVYRAGATANGFYIVIAGEVGLEHHSPSGKVAFYHSHGPGDLFGLLSEMDDSPRFSDARALKDSRLLHISHAECQDMIRHLPTMYRALTAMICQNLHTTLAMLVEQHSLPPRAQVAAILLNLARRRVEGRPEATRLTHEAMAAMAGISRQTAARILHAFQAEGLIEMQYRKVIAVDLQGLQQIVRSEL